jgi:ribose transport system ATP-binding protein
MRAIRKRFGATLALDGVDLESAPGEVHALIGENGAGKSTLMKVLSGALRPDSGSMMLAGSPYAPTGPAAARRRGVAMIYQELTLAPHLSVAENMLLGVEEHRFGILRRRRMRRRVEEALRVLEHPEISPEEPAGRLGISAQQLVEVGRALVAEAKVIILDEPTSSLTQRDTERLFGVLRRLKGLGVGIIYISHFLEEVREISDRFMVLRDGRTVLGGRMDEVPLERIIESMVGRSVEEMFPRIPHSPGEPILELQALAGRRAPRRADLVLRRGEIFGIAGLVGAGRTEMLRAIFGLDPVVAGKVKLAAAGDITGIAPARALRLGLGFLSEDRKDEGLLLNLSIADNLTLGDYRPVSRWGWISRRRQEAAARRWIDALAIKSRGPRQPAGALSGGNQQKVAVARLLHQDAEVLLLDEPTRGIDVGSKVQIYELMGRMAARGKAILFVSSYLPELLGVADRIAVMSRGVLSEARPREELDEEAILRLATLGGPEAPAGEVQ